MANGANLFFTKDVFIEIGGYQKNAQYASGDDMFLIQEIASRYPDKISFFKVKKGCSRNTARNNISWSCQPKNSMGDQIKSVFQQEHYENTRICILLCNPHHS